MSSPDPDWQKMYRESDNIFSTLLSINKKLDRLYKYLFKPLFLFEVTSEVTNFYFSKELI